MDKQKLLDNLSNKTYCRLCRSKNHGIGVFAIKDIPQGVNPFETDDNEETIEITDQDIVGIDPEVRKMIEDFSFFKDGIYYLGEYGLNGMNISYFLNTSKNPNMKSVEGGEGFIAAKEIKKGEELTVDYNF
ncbi:MAG: SET domain-containing protein-lysine N-methyltransferase [Parcubacteria group bacterium]|nr:MAG: SET domain-containing protein-lysine N-methyltransferase [Parcubacteria group bacterium]